MSRAYTPDLRTNPYRRINHPLRRGMERLRKVLVLARDEEDR